MNNLNIVVTGGAGFIGSYVCKNLIHRGDRVICIDDFNDYYDPKLKEDGIQELKQNKNFKLYREDIRNAKAMKQIFTDNHIDKVIHLAARAGVRASIDNPLLYGDVNINGTINLLELTRNFQIKNFVFASSSSVYGNTSKIPFSEDDPITLPISPYGVTKRAGELLSYTYHHLYKIPITCLRFFTVYGPRGRPDMALFKFTKLICEGKEIPVFGHGNMKRNFTYIDDIVTGVIAALDKNLEFEIINLGGSETIDLTVFIETIERKLGKKARKNNLSMQPGDMTVTWADCSKAEQLLGYKPTVSIEEGIGSFIQWYKKYYKVEESKNLKFKYFD
jgi:UDP-glucuronate 4-epimerase